MGDDYGGGDSSFGGGFSDSSFSPSSDSHHLNDTSTGHGWSSAHTDNHETPISFGSHSAKDDSPRGGDDRGGICGGDDDRVGICGDDDRVRVSSDGDRGDGAGPKDIDDVDSGGAGNDAEDLLVGGADDASCTEGQQGELFSQWSDPTNRQSDCDNCCANGVICCCETCTIM